MSRASLVRTTACEVQASSLMHVVRAETYNVTLPFLLQQAAWLYEQQLSQVRAQMRKVVSPQPAAPSPIPESGSGSATVGGQSMRRLGSGETGKTRQ